MEKYLGIDAGARITSDASGAEFAIVNGAGAVLLKLPTFGDVSGAFSAALTSAVGLAAALDQAVLSAAVLSAAQLVSGVTISGGAVIGDHPFSAGSLSNGALVISAAVVPWGVKTHEGELIQLKCESSAGNGYVLDLADFAAEVGDHTWNVIF